MENLERQISPASEGFKELIRSMLLKEEQGLKRANFQATSSYDLPRMDVEELTAADEEMYNKILGDEVTSLDFHEYRQSNIGNKRFTMYLANLLTEKLLRKEHEQNNK